MSEAKLSGWFVEDGDYYGPFVTHDDACTFRNRHRIEGQVCHLTLHRVSSGEMTRDEYKSGGYCTHIIDPAFVLDISEAELD